MLGYFRLLAAVGVLAAHVSNLVSPGTSRAMIGAFFVVSGYLISMTITENYRRNVAGFYWNRFLRLYPMYWVIAVGTLLASAPWFHSFMTRFPPEQQPIEWVSTFALTFYRAPSLIAPAWSLPYEITFYLLAPFLLALTFRRVPVGVILFGLVGALGIAATEGLSALARPFMHGYYEVPDSILASFPVFAFGCLLYHYRAKLPHRTARALQWAGVAGLALIVVIGSRFVSPDGKAFDSAFSTWIGLGSYAATAAMLVGWQGADSDQSKLAGDLTYPLYLVHWPLLRSPLFESDAVRRISDAADRLMPYGSLVAVSLLALVASLALSYCLLLLERRYITPLRSKARRSLVKQVDRTGVKGVRSANGRDANTVQSG